ncbi:MAG: hypothetical protein LBL31_00880, partial [Spirochaetaceae bacterium]|nr:hypothetical protein [Spirochaetaceae bacterium]
RVIPNNKPGIPPEFCAAKLHSQTAQRFETPSGEGKPPDTSRSFAEGKTPFSTPQRGVETTCRGGTWGRRDVNERRYPPSGEGEPPDTSAEFCRRQNSILNTATRC